MRAAAMISVTLMSVAVAADPVEVVVEGTSLEDPAVRPLPVEDPATGMSGDTAELLRSIPGVSGSRMGGHGMDPVIRGQSQNRINVLLDGAYVHGGCPNRMDPPTAYSPMETYDSVTVIKGSQTVLYGGGGSGGTILLSRITPRFAEGEAPRVRLGAAYKSNSNTRSVSADVAAGAPQGFVRGIVDYADAGNYRDGDGASVRSAYTSRSGNLILGYTPQEQTRVELSLEATREEDTLFAGSGMDSPKSDNDTVRLKIARDQSVGPFSGVRGELYRSDVSHVMDNFSLRPLVAGAMKMRVPTDSTTRGGRITGDLATEGGAVWTLGLDHQANNRNANRFSGPTLATLQSVLWPDADLKQTGVFAEVMLPAGRSDTLKAGLRYDRVSASAGRADAAAASIAGNSTPNDLYRYYYGRAASDHSEGNLGGFVRYEHTVGDGTLFAGASRSVRTADATERFMASNSMPAAIQAMRWVGNPDLSPEKHRQIEVGVSWAVARWSTSATVYYDDVNDYILRDRARGQPGVLRSDLATIYRNVDARLYGFEWDGRMNLGGHLQAGADLAYVNATDTTGGSRPLAQTPPLEGSLSLDYSPTQWSLGGRLRFAARQSRVDDNVLTGSGQDAGKSGGFGVLDLYGHYRLSRTADLLFGVDNLLDRTYAYHVNRANADPFNPGPLQVNEPGRELWLRARVTF